MTTMIRSIFVSHGAPTFALDPGVPGAALLEVGRQLLAQDVKALIVCSPHWRSAALEITSHEAPVIVHDFSGFPRELYELKPEIEGEPVLAHQLLAVLTAFDKRAAAHPNQGFDHGAWVPYMHLFPNGAPPMIQISMPVRLSGESAFELGRAVGEFAREHGAVVLGSGSLTHNFADMAPRAGNKGGDALAYIGEFTGWIQARLSAGDSAAIVQAEMNAPHFVRAHPDNDHYLPLPFALGAAGEGYKVRTLPEDVRYRALSMQSFVFSSNCK